MRTPGDPPPVFVASANTVEVLRRLGPRADGHAFVLTASASAPALVRLLDPDTAAGGTAAHADLVEVGSLLGRTVFADGCELDLCPHEVLVVEPLHADGSPPLFVTRVETRVERLERETTARWHVARGAG